MNIAKLNKRIIFQKNETTTDAIGNHINTWTEYFRCRGQITGEGGSEKLAAGKATDQVSLNITVRYCQKTAAVTSGGYRILLDGVVFNITAVDHFSFNHKSLKFICQKEGSETDGQPEG